jgi:ketosteroid isomerase-like protein
MEDAVRRYCAAVEAGDMTALAATFAPDVELPSPVIGSAVFRGRDDVGTLLSAVYSMLREVRWEPPVGEGEKRLAIATARIGPMRIDDAMVFELDGEGRIARIRPHLRPLAAMMLFFVMIGPRMARAPGVMLRALRR